MTLTPEAQSRIDERIRRLAGPRSPTAARDELRQHVIDAATDSALGNPVTVQQVDRAFDELGSDDEIRATFFPAKSNASKRRPLDRFTVALLAVSAAVAIGAILMDGGGKASCSVEGEGSCQATSSGQFLDLVLWSLPPLAILALLAALPAWPGIAGAAIYALLAALRLIDAGSTASWVEIGLVVAAGLALVATLRHWRRARGAANA